MIRLSWDGLSLGWIGLARAKWAGSGKVRIRLGFVFKFLFIFMFHVQFFWIRDSLE